jgi:hypothetical protein
MQSTILKLSLVVALCAAPGLARADDTEEFSLAQYAVPADGFDDGTDGDFLTDECDPGVTVLTPQHWFDAPDYKTYFQADALWLSRINNSDSQPIAVLLPAMTATVLTSDAASLQNKFQLGGLFTLGFKLDNVAAVEATYFGLNHWKNSATVNDPAGTLGLAGPVLNATTDFAFADSMKVDYSSRIHNAEINYKQTIEGLTLLTGFRYFRLEEDFNIRSHGFLSGKTSDYNVRAINQLIGWQWGLGTTQQWGRFSVGAMGKIGIYANAAEQKTDFRDQNNVVPLAVYKVQTTPVSVLGEIYVNASYQVLDWLGIHAGYRFIGLDNVAMAPGQLNFNNFMPFINAHEFLLLQGVNVGVEIRW